MIVKLIFTGSAVGFIAVGISKLALVTITGQLILAYNIATNLVSFANALGEGSRYHVSRRYNT